MRPMYFSHAKTSNTLMYGIGLKTDIQKSEEKNKAIGDAIAKLGTRAM